MIALVARFTAREGSETEVAWRIGALGKLVRSDPGTVQFRAFQDRDDARRFVVWEQYEDESAFREHIAMPHVVTFNGLLPPLIEEPSSVLEFLGEI
ncbi:putative quinol monooxygenase [Curtobacterium sp. MCBD17_003]|uniref:putative quinol monooxygenase n=1 Tax=Curtobacterium sp. MCBD17_003 TaxID=2175667 RepID=UPI0015E8A58A|nr:putative quinol monooxygenase [Curtobacterium sp. MCBD17_003]WIE54003.1 putative quinol monooxygenase [Curtobacterium sp. MCBD17_003]